jgi:hypothetical protein
MLLFLLGTRDIEGTGGLRTPHTPRAPGLIKIASKHHIAHQVEQTIQLHDKWLHNQT